MFVVATVNADGDAGAFPLVYRTMAAAIAAVEGDREASGVSDYELDEMDGTWEWECSTDTYARGCASSDYFTMY